MEVTPQIQNHLTANMNIRKRDIIIGNFLGGLSWGIGSVVGVTALVAVVGWVLNSLGVFNGISDILAPLNDLKNLNQSLPQVPQFTK